MQQQLYLFIFNVIHLFPGPISLLCRIKWVLEHEDNRMHLAKFSQFFDGPVNLPYVYYFGKEQGLQSSVFHHFHHYSSDSIGQETNVENLPKLRI